MLPVGIILMPGSQAAFDHAADHDRSIHDAPRNPVSIDRHPLVILHIGDKTGKNAENELPEVKMVSILLLCCY